jgi:5'-3' exoribonuclease 1
MGVPKFYRWISERYPQINQMLSGTTILPEFDNFYLDMNGIIHACTHPNDDQTANSLTEREMMLAIFRYIDHMVTEIVKPKKILFMAIDGVAPRAKLNQQRARRFRAAQERQEAIAKAKQKGEVIDEENMFDSNCITPGTVFMDMVGKHLRYFIRKKIKEDPLWRNLKIVFSGHDVPGEGEHKIMQFMRDLRADPHYEPNQRHCMYGQDADLIMLGLATHEPHFALLREVVNFNANRGGNSARQTVLRQTKNAQFQLLHLSLLREYLSLDFAFESTWMPDQERLFDDFIFLTFLVGNDFLPHLPSLDISEQAFDTLIGAYRKLMAEEPGYIVHNGEIGDLARLEKLCAAIGAQESTILQAREEDVKAFNKKRRKFKDANILSEEELEEAEEAMQRAFESALNIAMGKEPGSDEEEDGSNEEEEEEGGSGGAARQTAAEVDELVLDEYGEPVQLPEWEAVGKDVPTTVSRGGKGGKGGKKSGGGRGGGASESKSADAGGATKDYSGRYYYEKFNIVASSDTGKAFLSEVMHHYLQGLMWCLAYYIKGCVSWTWYYPYHYGPMLKDFTGLQERSERIHFELGQPFMPYQQLLGCLPPASCNLLPTSYQWLMISADSPVLHFYPEDFGIDQDGKKNPWEAVVLLDFIDEKQLVAAEQLHCPPAKLTRAERERNAFGNVLTYTFEPGMVEGYPSCNPKIGLPDIPCCQSVVAESYPSLAPGTSFKAELVPGTVYPIAGYPSLTILPLQGMKTEAIKVNMFGSESKYRSLVLDIMSPALGNIDNLNVELLLGRIVYVNYPQIHEAKVVAVSTEKEEVRLDAAAGAVKRTEHDAYTAQQWREESEQEEEKYLKGRGTPGTGGLCVGPIVVRLRVAALQGLERNPVTGACKKVFSSLQEADVPIQMALWAPPVADTRFEETSELAVEDLMPFGAEVVALKGPLMGCKGRVVGPHADAAAAGADAKAKAAAGGGKRSSLKEDIKKDADGHAGVAGKPRVVDVEFSVIAPEPPFGYAIASAIKEDYFTSKELCSTMGISPSVLGKIVGMVRVEPGRADLGLNLKRNGQYQLLGYTQLVDFSHGGGGGAGGKSAPVRKVWGGVDTVEIVGMVGTEGSSEAQDKAAELDGATWQYSARAAALIYDYKASFPYLFQQLERLPHQPTYSPDALLGPGGDKKLEAVQEWMKAQPYFKLPRTPFTTSSLCKYVLLVFVFLLSLSAS